jgi:phosphatidylglycerol lysyltransferase
LLWRREKSSYLIWIVALVTLGSGLLDVYSVIGPSLPERRRLLREIFPLAVLNLSRFSTLLIGFALVISSINVFKRKRRAFPGVFLLAALSVLFHLTKGFDYEEALLSLVLIVLLTVTRDSFTVESSIPDLREGLLRFAIAALVAVSYGVFGLWLLEPTHFGVNFTMVDSIRRTLLLLSLVGDPELHPLTRYAEWFEDSLYLMTATAIGYSIFALFRPVIYRYRIHPHEIEMATRIVEQHGRSSQDYFKLWPDKSYFFSGSHTCFLAYSVGGNFAVVLSDPVGPEGEIEDIIRRFMEFCRQNDWALGFHSTLPDFLPIYQKLGFKRLKVGDEAIVDLTRFSAEGKKTKELKKLHQLDKLGVHILRHEPPIPEEVLAQLKEVSDEWLEIPGRRERQFTLGKFEAQYVRSTPVFTAVDKDGKVLAFANLIPSYRKGEAVSDLMRRRTQAPSGIMDYLFIKLFLEKKEKGFERFSLGMAPMAGFQEKEEASPEERAVHAFFQRLNFLFSYRGLRAYKAKWATVWEPRYAVYRNVFDLPRLAVALSKVSEIRD